MTQFVLSIRLYAFERAHELFKKGHYRLDAFWAYEGIADVHLNKGRFDWQKRN
jgi:hypothetical protein